MSKRDIRSVRYRRSDFPRKNFKGAKAGHNLTWKWLLAIFGVFVSCLCTVLPVLASTGLAEIITNFGSGKPLTLVAGLTAYASAVYIISSYKTDIFPIAISCSLLILGTAITYFDGNPDLVGFFVMLLISTISTSVSFLALSLSLTFAYIRIGRIGGIATSFVVCLLAVVLSRIFVDTSYQPSPGEETSILISSFSIITVASLIAWQSYRGVSKFHWIKDNALFWAATGGTSFYELDLSECSFDNADLKYTDFRKADLSQASFRNATGLDLARLQGTILENTKIRQLLVTGNGRGQDFTQLNLSGANLTGVDLEEAILIRTNLLNANLSSSTLTNACIQDWTVNLNTNFEDIKCSRIYLKRSQHGHFLEPKPDSGNFQDGEFEKWIAEIHDTVDLIFRNGLNWRAFAFSLAQTAIIHEELGLSVRSIENKSNGLVVAKVSVSSKVDKAKIHEELSDYYQDAKHKIESRYELILKAKDSEIQRLVDFTQTQQRFIQGLVPGISETHKDVIIQGEGNRIYVIDNAGNIIEGDQPEINIEAGIDMSSSSRVSVNGDVTSSSIIAGDSNLVN